MENVLDTIDAPIPPPSELRARCLREIALAQESAQAALQHARNANAAYTALRRDGHDAHGLPWITLLAFDLLTRISAELPLAPAVTAPSQPGCDDSWELGHGVDFCG